MALLQFSLSKPVWNFRIGTDSAWSATYELRSSNLYNELRLASGGDLLRIPGTLHIRAGEIDQTVDNVFGMLHYLEAYKGSNDGVFEPEAERFTIECTLSAEQVKALIEFEKSGRGANEVSVQIPSGIMYGNLPDGSDMSWDNKKASMLGVNSLSFTFDHQEKPLENDVPTKIEDNVDTTKLSVLTDSINAMNQRSTIIIFVLGLIAAAVIFK
jgi:hypothetical protein